MERTGASSGGLCLCSRARHPSMILDQIGARFTGVLQVDGYGAYKALVKRTAPGRIWLAFCLAHARRKSGEVHKATTSPAALEIIQRIAAVYAIEEPFAAGPAEHRQSVRVSASAPLMATFAQRLVECSTRFRPRRPLARPIPAIRCGTGMA